MAEFPQLPAAVRRRAYRSAFVLLRGYWFLRRPHKNGVKCVLTEGDRVLLVRHTYGTTDWELPGGGSKTRERGMSAARREMLEELGVAIDEWTPLGRISARMNHRIFTLHCFQPELHDPQ